MEDTEKVEALVTEVRHAGIALSILDVNNAYMSTEAVTRLLNSFEQIATDQSILITTELPYAGGFRYSVYKFGHR